MLTLDKFEEASEKVKEVTLETKLVYSDYLSSQTGNKVYLKPENMQFTGAYKVRGAYYKISTLTDEEREKGLITASAGNHAQGVAYAAKCFGCKAVIVMPTTTPLIKVNRTKSYGAEVVLYGDVYDEACQKAYELAEKNSCNRTGKYRNGDIQGTSTGGIYPGSDRRRWTGNRCIDTGKTLKSKDQSHRCRAGRSKLYAGIFCSRKGDHTSECQHDCRWYRSKDPGKQYFPIYPEKSGRYHYRAG